MNGLRSAMEGNHR